MSRNKHGTADLELGQYNEVLEKVLRVLPKALTGIPYGDLKGLPGDVLKPALRQAFLNAIKGNIPDRPCYSVTVNYGLPVEEMVAAGSYDYVNSDITSEHFPAQGQGKQEKEITLFHFNRQISSKQAIKKMDEQGYRPAEPEEILTLGAEHPDIQRQFPIVALGSSWQHPVSGRRCIVCLWGRAGGRFVRLDFLEGDWDSDCRFAAVRK